MCGITGLWGAANQAGLNAIIDAMTDTLVHRGPDDRGTWIDEAAAMALGHRRLAIIDLSAEGHQPMTSANGRFVLVYNGEVYNFAAIRRQIAAEGVDYPFRGNSDTEVILAAIQVFGLKEGVRRFNGMFAFALWDREKRKLHLVRDRLGIKPLYYGRAAEALVFGSELKALRAHPRFSSSIDRRGLADLLRFNSIPAPRTIYADVQKLPPATIATFASPDQPPTLSTYWSAADVAQRGIAEPLDISPDEAVDQLEETLRQAVETRMVADVPLGAFLSGGIDSSTVVALMQDRSPRPIKTFSIGFERDDYNEAIDAAAVAEHLGTDHHEWYITADDALSVIPDLPQFYDEPFADSSQIPTFLVSKLARKTVTVALSGDGGDELFAGYNRHIWAPRIWRLTEYLPAPARAALARILGAATPSRVDRIYGFLEERLPGTMKVRLPAEKLQKLAAVIACGNRGAIYGYLRSDWQDPADLVLGLDDSPAPPLPLPEASFSEQMMLADLLGYLPTDILTKVDRASMALSLEARVPLLDHNVVELAWRLPMDLKIRDGVTKWALRQVLYRYVPRELIERPKMGFGVPIDEWLRGPLRPWAEELLDKNRLRQQGYLDPNPIHELWAEHLQGRANHQHKLWNILAFQAWLE